ncbi:MAG: glycosyltransferase [Eubacterium sp.]
MASISLCMIVKNEEKVLARCLDSIKDAVDEIVIVDTGSNDNTKNIALKYTDFVYDYKWADDFSKARNFSFSKATKDFIMWLDADDVVTEQNRNKIIELKEQLDNTDAIMLKYNTAFDEDGNATFSYYRERIIRRRILPVWKGRVHEVIEYHGRTIYSDAAINHQSEKTEYSTRNLEIYEKQFSEGAEMKPRDLFYFARELYYHKKYSRSIKMLCDFLKIHDAWIENKIEACKILSFCYSETGEKDKALSALFQSFIYDKPRAEICCLAGNLFMSKNEYDKAVYWFETALNIPQYIEDGAFTDLNAYGYLPCIQLCVCYDKLKNYQKAEEYNNRAGAYRPNSDAYLSNLKYFESLHIRGIL